MQEISQYQETSVGSYRLFQLVGVGPLSHTHLAERQDWPERQLVVKLFDMVPLHSREEQDQVLDEVRLLAFLEHPSILPILDDGMRGETLYLVSPSLEARSLRQRMAQASSELLPLKEALAILRQVGDALHFAHTQQVVHANLKPENILLQSDGKVFLADFLLPALAQSGRTARMRSTFAAFYMAPEQFRGERTPASDQYALACLAYELLTGKPPFEADDVQSLARKHETEQPPSPAALQPKRAQHVEHALLKALSKRPEERYPDIQAFLVELSAPPPLATVAPALAQETPQSVSPSPTDLPQSPAPGIHEETTVLLPSVAPGALLGLEKQHGEEDRAPVSEQPRRFSRRQIGVIVGLVCLALLVSVTSIFSFLSPSSSNHAQVHAGAPSATPRLTPSPGSASPGATSTTTVVGITLHASPTPAPRPSPAPTPEKVPTATPSPTPARGCAVTYTVSNQQSGSFIGNLTITNTGSTTIQGWKLVFSFTAGQRVIGPGWNGHFSQKGPQVTVTNLGGNGTIAPGSSLSPGFQGSWNGSNPAPTSFTLNGIPCH